MSDIFISYSSHDRPWVEPFAKVLESHGWSVWWDHEIPTGGSFNAVIQQELSAAKCAIVVWSEQSVEREWVQAEAAEAKKQEKYLPVKISECKLPLGFSQRTYQSLKDWDPGVEHAGFAQLLKDIERLVKSPLKPMVYGPKPWWKRVHPIWCITSPALLAAVVVIGLMLWPIPAQVEVQLTTERIEFEVGAKQSEDSYTLSGMVADAVGIENFETITFAPSTIEVADPAQYQFTEDTYPAKAWRRLDLADSQVIIVAHHQARHSRVMMEGVTDKQGTTAPKREAIRLDSIAVASKARVSLETRAKEKREQNNEKKEGVTIKVAGLKEFIVNPGRQVTFITDHVEIRGLKGVPFKQNDELTYRVTFPEQSSRVVVTVQSDELVLLPTFVLGPSAHQVFGGIPVTTLDFTRQVSEADGGEQTLVKAGERVSALTGDGSISFPEYKDLLETVSIKQDEAVGLEHLDGFTIQELKLTADGTGIHLRGEGIAKEIRMRSGQIPIQSHHLTALDALWHNARLVMVMTIIATVFTTSLGAYRLWKELKH